MVLVNGDHEFQSMMTKGFEDLRQKLVSENQVLKDNLAQIHKDLNDMLQVRKEIYIRRKKIEMGEEYSDEVENQEFNLLPIKKDLF